MLALARPPAAPAQELRPPLCGTGVHVGETSGAVAFPSGDVFCALLADPKGEASFLTLARGDFPTLTEEDADTDLGSVGVADAFPLVRWNGSRPGEGVQLSLSGGVFAQFDLRAASFDLINADYVVGLPATGRFSGFSFRIRPYHQSSHLGDEYVLRDDPVERQNLSFESLELILSQELGALRVYGGGEYLFRREPDTLEDLLAHGGAEIRLGESQGPRFVIALDAKSTEQQDWNPAWSARGGVELALWREPGHPPRLWSVLLEYYDGPSPYGQFFREHISYFGLGLHFAL
jgi:hypothetical protein